MNGFSYDRINGTSQKMQQNSLNRVSDFIQRRLLSKVLSFINKI